MAEETPQEQPVPEEPAPEADPTPEVEAGPADEALASLEQATAAVDAVAAEAGAGEPATLPDFAANGAEDGADAAGMQLLNDVALNVKIELGRTSMYVEDLLRLNANSVIELDKAAGDPVDIYVNDRYIARGEVLVLNENFCVRISEIIQAGSAEE